MKRKLNHSVVVGIFITIGLIILGLAVFILGSQQKAFARASTIKAIFQDVNGLQAGNNVWLFGVKVGTVKKVNFYGETKVEVIMSIESDAMTRLHKDATAKISSDGLIGNKIIVLSGGTKNTPLVRKDDYINIAVTPGTDEMLAMLQQNNRNLLAITSNIKELTGRLVNGEGSLGQLLKDTTMAVDIKSAIARFKAVAVRSEQVIANVQQFSEGLHKPGTLADDLITDTTVFAGVQASVTNLNNASISLRDAMLKVNNIADSLQKASSAISDTKKPVGMILNDKQVAQDLRLMIDNLVSSSQKLNDDLEALQHNFLLRGFFRKREKEQEKQKQ
ncbi:MAG TPA: MlaD family protein [Chitinophagaceae bacterium]|nr:MlaD family protein [Chitinophagaceae bacterium]